MTPTSGTRPLQSVFAGQSASPGVACGPAVLRFAGIDATEHRRIREDEISAELGRLDSVARAARVSLVRQREALAEQFTPEQRQVFDTHLAMLEDPVIEADVRERIQNQRMPLEAAVKDVFHVYERLFEVVETASLRNKISDMRDVTLRYLRHCERGSGEGRSERELRGGILVVRELTLSDLTECLENGVAGVVAEEGSLGSHGAILTAAAGIPAVIGVAKLRDVVRDGQTLLVDGHAGQVLLDPTEDAIAAAQNRAMEEDTPRLTQPTLDDGTPLRLLAAAGSVREVRTAARIGVEEVGLYRTELPVIQRHGAPREVSLAALYRQVVSSSACVNFRLPDLDSTSPLPEFFPEREPNPALGQRGCRLLLAHPELLRLELRAILRASEGRVARVAVPFVETVDDLRRVREVLDATRAELRLAGVDVSHPVRLGVVFENPASALLCRQLLQAADFALLALDGLAQYLLAFDRQQRNARDTTCLNGLHPVVLRAVHKIAQVAEALETPLTAYGQLLAAPRVMELLVGAGLRRFALPAPDLPEARERLDGLDLEAVRKAADRAANGGAAMA